MTTAAYMAGRQKYSRPQAMAWADSPGTLEDGLYIPNDYEVNAFNNGAAGNQFVILSDDNRGPIDFKIDRIEKRERMINGRMRSYHIADKLTISTEWQMLPSRAFALDPNFNDSGISNADSLMYTSDGGAGGVDILDWYEKHQGSFWVFLAYDKYNSFGNDDAAYGHLQQYNQVVEMFFSDFSYSVEKRGANSHDFWNISVTLEEV